MAKAMNLGKYTDPAVYQNADALGISASEDGSEDKKESKAHEEKEKKLEDELSKFTAVLPQIQAEYDFALKFIIPKWNAWVLRLKLYNNQKRNKEDIGDPLLFTVMQTVLASVYSDQLTTNFIGREHGDDDRAENLNIMAQYDAEEMNKAILDYEWAFDTCFTGNGLVLMNEWDDDRMVPVPEVIDPLTFLRDPDCAWLNGDQRGRGGARFFGREFRMTALDIEQAGVYADIDCLTKADDSTATPVEINKQARRDAQGFDALRQSLTGDNKSYILHEWFTYWKGEKYIFTTARDRTKLMRAEKIETRKWPVVQRKLYPTAHDFDGVSIPDLCEDKQRGRAAILNLAKKGITAKLYPNYTYNNLLIKNKADIAKIEFNKFVGVPGNPQNVVAPIPRENITNDVQWILDYMNGASQKATATPDIQQGAMVEKVKSAAEISKVSQGVETRYSLTTKVFGWSERDFWKLWYEKYVIHFKPGIYEKIVRIAGALGPEYRKIRREDVIGEADPDIFIESKILSDAKKMNKVNMDMAFMNQGVAMDPNFNKRFALQQIGKDMGKTTDELNRLMPPTFDEYEAMQENKILEQNKVPKLSISQNHMVHIQIHSLSADTPAKKLHIEMHKVALYAQSQNPALNPGADQGLPPGAPTAAPMTTGAAPAPRDMAQSPQQLQAPNAIQATQ